MTAGSNLVAVQQALVAALAARPGLAGVQVRYDMPITEVTSEELWFDDAEAAVNMPVHRGGGAVQRMEEEIALNGTVQVIASQGQTQEQADVRCLELLAEVQQQLAEQPMVTSEIMWAIFSGWKKIGAPLEKGTGHGSRFEFRINVKARLYPA